MKDKEKQIEEMAKIIDDRLLEARNWLGSMNKGEGYWIAQELVKHYQQKIPEDSVVLTREEYDNLKLEIQKAQINGVQAGLDMTKFKEESIKRKARKETAKDIIDFIKTLKVDEDGRHEWRDHHNDSIDRVTLKLNQRFINNVEVNE